MLNAAQQSDLEGILVLCLEQAVAAPYASQRLADAGARVIKVEREEGDFARSYDRLVNGESAYFVWLNHGKESICLDLKDQDDLQLLQAIIAKADVVIQNLAPGAADRLGIGAKAMTECHPQLIYCSISGYGEDGPYREQKAYDMLIQGESGLLAINGTPEEAARVGISICDISAGITAHGAIVQALFTRSRSGRGRIIEVSLFQAIADWMNVPYLQTRYGHKAPQRVGVNHPTIAPYGAYYCSDGKQILISIQNEREWQRFCDGFLGNTSLKADVRFLSNVKRCQHRAELDLLLSEYFAKRPREVTIKHLVELGIACGRMADVADLITHPQARRVAIQGENGLIELLAPGARSIGDVSKSGAVPKIGEHTEAIRKEFLQGS